MKKTYEIFSGKDLEVAELILRRRMQMLVHSYIYYKLNTNLISDKQFDMWGRELVKLQEDYPEIAHQVEYADAFKDWDASTGFHLPTNEQIVNIAHRLTHTAIANKVEQPKPKMVTLSKKKNIVRKSLF